ncbi:MAG: hypothetical protein JNJ85_10335 [Candidatus Kapabacteria bacterium]|nr:hypothetical protein [Candidatus Kapabacteria bacterium]
MSTHQDDLFSLIHSLSKTERRYFKVHFSNTSATDTQKYLRVFDVLAQMKEYNKEELTIKVPGDITGRYYSKTKAYLTDCILDAMLLFAKGGGKFQEETLTELASIHFLLRKNLLHIAKRNIAKLKKKCTDSESILLLLEVLNLEMHLHSGVWDKLRPLNQEFERYLDLLKHDVDVYNLHYTIIELELSCSVRPNEQQRKQILSYQQELGTYRLNDVLMDTQRRIYSSQAICHHMLNQPKEAYHVLEEYINKFNQQPNLYRDTRAESFSRILQNAYSFAFRTGNIGFYKNASIQLQHTIDNSNCHESLRFELHLIKTFHLIALSGDYKHLEESVQYVEREQERINDIVPVRRMDLMFNISLGYFKIGKPKQSIEWLNRLFTDPDVENFPATLRHARILEILLHWKLQNTTLVLSRIRAFQRKLTHTPDLGAFEKVLLRFLNSVASKETYSNFQKELQHFRDELAKLDNTTYTGIVRHYEDLLAFLQK